MRLLLSLIFNCLSINVSQGDSGTHQDAMTTDRDDELLKQLLSNFPPDITFAFAYGSAVVHQVDDDDERDHAEQSSDQRSRETIEEKMIDLIIVVDDPLAWHLANLDLNPSHYSFLGLFGAKGVTFIQQNFKAQIYFNVVMHVNVNDSCHKSMKYGVIQTQDYINDLSRWDNLYVSGRLHKPVHIILKPNLVHPSYKILHEALERNYRSALYVSLLLLPNSFTEDELFWTIAGLSYLGDFRMIVGEDKNKVMKIVKPQLKAFRSLYEPFIVPLLDGVEFSYDESLRTYSKKTCPRLLHIIIKSLPESVHRFVSDANMNGLLLDGAGDRASFLAKWDSVDQAYRECAKKAITQIVWRSSLSQGVKGFFTTGFIKAIKYCGRKLVRMYASLAHRN